MRPRKLAVALAAAIVVSVLSLPAALASGNNPCQILSAEKFTHIMGYGATVQTTGSTATTCFYQGPEDSGGQFMILTETASGPQADAMVNQPGSSPPPGSGLIGGTYKKGSIIFSVSITSDDQSKLQALVAEVKRNLK